MATKRDKVTVTSSDNGATRNYSNPDVATRLQAARNKRANFTMPQEGKRTSTLTQEQRMAKSREYAARKQPERGNSRNRTTSPTTQPVARPSGAQGPLMQNGNYGMGSNSAPLAGSPPGAFAQRGAPAQPAYNPLPTYSTQPVQRPSVFRQPNSSMAMGIQGGGQVNPYGASMNPAQVMGGYQPPVSNPWRRQW